MTALDARIQDAISIKPPPPCARAVKPRFRGPPQRDDRRAEPRSRPLFLLILATSTLLFAASAVRHYLFRSGAMDLAFFDQLTWLISRGESPVSSLTGFHLLADHAAWILYLVAPLYRLFPGPHVLLAVQAIALAGGAYPLWRIAMLNQLSPAQALAIATAYLLYPIVLAANVFDFHPEALAIPALLCAVWFARRGRFVWFTLAVLLALGTKEIVGLTVLAMGSWLLFTVPQKRFAIVAIGLGAGWFLFATLWLIPHLGGGQQASGVRLFAYLGPTVPRIATAIFVHPELWQAQVLRPRVALYLLVIFGPICWGLSWRSLWPLLAVAPTLALNILADRRSPENLLDPLGHYSLIAVPFLAVALAEGVASGRCLIIRPRVIVVWSIAVLLFGAGARLAMAHGQQIFRDARPGDANRSAMLHAMSLIPPDAAVLTTHEIAPHLSDRKLVQFVGQPHDPLSLDRFDLVLLNDSQESLRNAPEIVRRIQHEMRGGQYGEFDTICRQGDVVLYRHRHSTASAKAE